MIVTPTEPTILPVSQVTATIPIVMVAATDPVGSLLIRSLAHPGGNVTGLVTHSSELGPKRLELLRQAIPRLSSSGDRYARHFATGSHHRAEAVMEQGRRPARRGDREHRTDEVIE